MSQTRIVGPDAWSGLRLPRTEADEPSVDALAELFLGPAAPESGSIARITPSPGPRPERTRVDLVVLGNLPVMGSVWVGQHARDLAGRTGGWIGVVRIRGGEVRVEAVGPTRPGTEALPRELAGAAGLSLEEAVARLAPLAAAWVVRADAPWERTLSTHPGVTGQTLLMGADEASVVAGYRTLKRLSPGELARTRVALMAADETTARRAAAKIADATRSFLGRAIEVTVGSERISGGTCLTLHSGPSPTDIGAVISLISDPAPTPARSEPAAPDVSADSPEPVDPGESVDLGEPVDPSESVDPGESVEHDHQPIPDPPALVRRLPGLSPLRAACPKEPRVELAVSSDGRLHLLTRAGRGGVAEGVRRLMAASAWSREHAPLLRLTGIELAAKPPIAHLFTDDPASARSILDADVRVHVLAPVEVEGRVGWFCSPLN